MATGQPNDGSTACNGNGPFLQQIALRGLLSFGPVTPPLCLLAILCDPEPPPLVCIEEPELGLHPDILPKLADLLVSASERTQLIVTTHSSLLVDAMTDRPESIVVCEKHQGQRDRSQAAAVRPASS
jgi:predicted ATPase